MLLVKQWSQGKKKPRNKACFRGILFWGILIEQANNDQHIPLMVMKHGDESHGMESVQKSPKNTSKINMMN